MYEPTSYTRSCIRTRYIPASIIYSTSNERECSTHASCTQSRWVIKTKIRRSSNDTTTRNSIKLILIQKSCSSSDLSKNWCQINLSVFTWLMKIPRRFDDPFCLFHVSPSTLIPRYYRISLHNDKDNKRRTTIHPATRYGWNPRQKRSFNR